MTQPTIEQFLRDELWSVVRSLMCHGISINDDYHHGKKFASYEEYSARIDAAARERAAEIDARIRAALAERQDNTLPLDEVPNGWRMENVELVFPIGNPAPECSCRLSAFPEQYDDVTANGATPAEALRAAIKKALEAIASDPDI